MDKETDKTAAAAAATTTPPEPKDPVALSPEELEYQRNKMLSAFGYAEDPEKDLPPLEEKPKKTEEDLQKATKETKKADKPDKEKGKPDRLKAGLHAKKGPPEESREELASRVAAETAAETVKRMKPADKPAPGAEEFALPPKEKRMLEVFTAMEEGDPKLKGLADNHVKFWKKAAKYAENWAKENPGKTFNPDDDEHTDFYSFQPAYDQDVFDDTRISLIAEDRAKKIADERVGKTNKDVASMRVAAQMREEAPQVVASAQDAKVSMIKAVLPDLIASLAGDGEFALNNETIDKLQAEDPLAFKVVSEAADELGWQVHELERLSRYAGSYPEKPEMSVELVSTAKTDAKGRPIPGTARKFQPHRELIAFAQNLEQQLVQDPDSTVDGRTFLTQAQWHEKAQGIMGSAAAPAAKQAQLKALNERHWRLSSEQVKAGLVAEYAQRSQERIAELTHLLELRGKKSGNQNANGTENGAAATTEKPGVIKERVKPPSGASASDKVDGTGSKAMSDEEKLAQVTQAAF